MEGITTKSLQKEEEINKKHQAVEAMDKNNWRIK